MKTSKTKVSKEVKAVGELPFWTMIMPDYGLLEGRTREFVDRQEVLEILTKRK